MLDAQREYLDDFWDSADVEVDGDPDCQQAVRFGLFHVLQASARAERRRHRRQGTDRHRLRRPRLLGHRGIRPAGAHLHRPQRGRRRAALAGVDAGSGQGARGPARPAGARPSRGARSAVRSARRTGRRAPRRGTSTPTSPMAFERYRIVTGDESLEADCGLAVLVETARLWLSLGHHDRHGVWHLDGVTGPDEYTARRARQRLHQPDGGAQPARPPPRRATATRRRRTAGRDDRGDGRLARRGRRGPHSVRRGARASTSSARASPRSPSGTSTDNSVQLSAAAARAVCPAVPGAGGQAGRPGAGDALAEPRVHARAEGAQRGLLRAAHRPRLVPVGLHAGGDVRRGRPPASWRTTTPTRPR